MTIELETGEKKEIALPHYRQWNQIYVKIIDEESCLTAQDWKFNPLTSIKLDNYYLPHFFDCESKEITAEEFETAYNEILTKLAKLI